MEGAQNQVSFRVDAGLINRLGRELVGKAETAVSELVKNSYDADSTYVEVNFIDTDKIGGKLIISDNGVGMSFEQLVKGFMTISSTEKIHNPLTDRFKRSKAGKKGIGRFATQRLGEKLTIITQTKESEIALKVIIDWSKYSIDHDITLISFPVEEIEKNAIEGTSLIIENLREVWNTKAIERVFRYVSELLQPIYLSDISNILGLAVQEDDSFKVNFFKTTEGNKEVVTDPQRMLFDKSVAVIEGFVDKHKEAFFGIKSTSLEIDDYCIPIIPDNKSGTYNYIQDIHFKVYYFIYNRPEYYSNITKLELKNIQTLSKDYGGIRVYRNGFRVLPYGESSDDWLGLDIRYSGGSAETGLTNIPYANRNLFGFVEIIDPEGINFEETASREGLIENEALEELKDFVHKALIAARGRIAEKITIIRKNKKKTSDGKSNDPDKTDEDSIKDNFQKLEEFFSNEHTNQNQETFKQVLSNLKENVENTLEELGMLRVLAGLGLTIAEFTHEIIQFTPSMNGYISALYTEGSQVKRLEILEGLKKSFNHFTAYTAYFNATISQNVSRELKPVLLSDTVDKFIEVIADDLLKQNISIEKEFYDFDLYTIPMHASEWNSILFNLYTNSKKAIKRTKNTGCISIICGKEDDKIYLEFSDNGDGIPEENKPRVFNAFFTTSTPAGYNAAEDEKLTGTGLGLKIVKDIIEGYRGKIFLLNPEIGYSTCFRIEIPIATNKQLKDYGI